MTAGARDDIPAQAAGWRRTSSGKAAEIEALIEAAVEAMGYRIVRVLLTGSDRQPSLQIMAEPADGTTMTVEGCAEVSRAVEAILDVEDPIDSAYTLEVSSPGIDRPLTRAGDFPAWLGFDVKVELAQPRDGRRRFKGRLVAADARTLAVEVEDGSVRELALDEVEKAKLVLTDALIAAVQDPQGQD